MEIQPSGNKIDTHNTSVLKFVYVKAKQFVLNFLNGRLGGHWCLFWMFMLMTIYPIASDSAGIWFPVSRFSLWIAAYFVAYVYIFIGSLIKPKALRNIYFTIVFAIVLLHSIIDTACIHTIYAALNRDIVSAILATNANEASEFVGTYFTPQVVISVAILVALIIGLLVMFKKVHFRTSVVACRLGTMVFLVCAVVVVKEPLLCNYTSVGFIRQVVIVVAEPNVELNQATPTLTINSKNQPTLIVFIIGESLTNHHCSLYGYDKPTNPFTKPRVEKGEVLLFKNVTASATHTQEAFQKMMSTYEKSMGSDVKWYECPTLPNIAKAANYRTHWISNQSKKGFNDNIVGQYSDLCDTCVFIGNKFAGLARTNYDGELLPVFKSMLQKDHSVHNLYILHLMGCHASFDRRYPSSFSFFKENDYKKFPENQRKGMVTYDNAVRYNDYVVNSVFNIVSQQDAIVIYAPDHGLDVYESNNVAAHSNDSNPVGLKAALDIPFLIYMTPQFRERHTDFVQRASQSLDREFDMEDIIYLIMDLMQCDFEKPVVSQKSLIRK